MKTPEEKAELIKILERYSYNVENQAGDHLNVVDSGDWNNIINDIENIDKPPTITDKEIGVLNDLEYGLRDIIAGSEEFHPDDVEKATALKSIIYKLQQRPVDQ